MSNENAPNAKVKVQKRTDETGDDGEDERSVIALDVTGIPAPKGSGRAILIGGRARHVPSGSDANRDALRDWDRAIKASIRALEARSRFAAFPAETPLRVSIEFRFARPDSHYGTGRNANTLKPSAPGWPIGRPDIDKLARATLDSLIGIAFHDDSRIVELSASKRYAELVEGYESMTGWSGARIVVAEWGSPR